MKRSGKKLSLANQSFITECTKKLPYEGNEARPHIFHRPISYGNFWIHSWIVNVNVGKISSQERHFFSLFENGHTVSPDKDPRFSAVYRARFNGQPWVECYFVYHMQLISFIMDAAL